MSRKQIFANLANPASISDQAKGGDGEELNHKRKAPVRPLLGSPTAIASAIASPVGVLGKSLSELKDRSKRADEIEQQLMSGETIVKLDPADIEPSFIPDRMMSDDPRFDSLMESMRTNGQKVPILVRPHPDKPNKFQTAYGWRRTRVAAMLDVQVDAIVRQLSDEDLIKAQGQENNERKDLSYIEKARWAYRLTQRFSRDFVMSALSVHKSDLSNMLSVIEKTPEDLIDAIGPADDAGRRQWMSLAQRLQAPTEVKKARALAENESFRALGSTERLQAIMSALKPGPAGPVKDVLHSPSGHELGTVTKSRLKLTITIDRKKTPEFADYVADQLSRLAREYHQGE